MFLFHIPLYHKRGLRRKRPPEGCPNIHSGSPSYKRAQYRLWERGGVFLLDPPKTRQGRGLLKFLTGRDYVRSRPFQERKKVCLEAVQTRRR